MILQITAYNTLNLKRNYLLFESKAIDLDKNTLHTIEDLAKSFKVLEISPSDTSYGDAARLAALSVSFHPNYKLKPAYSGPFKLEIEQGLTRAAYREGWLITKEAEWEVGSLENAVLHILKDHKNLRIEQLTK